MSWMGVALCGVIGAFFMWQAKVIDQELFTTTVLPIAAIFFLWGAMSKAIDRS